MWQQILFIIKSNNVDIPDELLIKGRSTHKVERWQWAVVSVCSTTQTIHLTVFLLSRGVLLATYCWRARLFLPWVSILLSFYENLNVITSGPEEGDPLKNSYEKLCDAYGILGNLRLSAGDRVLHYLCLVTGAVSVGKLGKGEVYKITDCKMISLRGYSPDEERVVEVDI